MVTVLVDSVDSRMQRTVSIVVVFLYILERWES